MNESNLSEKLDRVCRDVSTLFDLYNEQTRQNNKTEVAIAKFEVSLNAILENNKDTKESVKEIKNKIEQLSDIPSKKWNGLMNTVITAIVSGGITFAVTQLVSK
jgi:hypothetical protein